jgi:hypothetical protein
MTILTASGGFGREASSFKFAELIPETDFFAYSRMGLTPANSSSTDYFFDWIFVSYFCN